jgi:xylulokinase
MYLLGIDLGTSSIKVSLVDAQTQQEVVSAQYPDIEASISSPFPGWAEQDPDLWWENTQQAILRLKVSHAPALKEVKAIGISYQMHGLVMLNKSGKVLRPSIIWCDSRAVEVGERAFQKMGKEKALKGLLNSPGNFTASKLAWVKENEPEVFAACHKMMLPGDYIAYKMTGEMSTTITGLSEGIFWDFSKNTVSLELLQVLGFSEEIIPKVKSSFEEHGQILNTVSESLGINAAAVVSYKAGDQPNNAWSLNVIEPGEIAATAGTSGVVYAVSDKIEYDTQSRINSFAHVNHGVNGAQRIGILLCINGTGILNRWVKEQISGGLSYTEINALAATAPIGSLGLNMLPFGNGAERMLANKNLGAQISGLDFNMHTQAHLARSAQEGIAFSLAYGFGLMLDLGVKPNVIRAGQANMFLSSIFADAVVNTSKVPVEMYDTHGAKGAALGAGWGAGTYKSAKESMQNLKMLGIIEPNQSLRFQYEDAFEKWKSTFQKYIA